jgi:hypothetical protein
VGTQGPRGALEVDRATVGIGLIAGLGESGCLTGAGTPPTGGVVYGGVDVREAHSEMLVKQWLESRCWRAIAVLQAACTTMLVREHMSLRRPLTSVCTMRSSLVDAGLVSACSPAREISVSWEMGARALL